MYDNRSKGAGAKGHRFDMWWVQEPYRCSTYVTTANNRDYYSDVSAVALILKNIDFVGNPYFLFPGIKFCHFNAHGSVHRKNIQICILQDATLHSLLYLETALHASGGTSTHHQDRKQLYLQRLVFVTPLLLPAAGSGR